MLATSAGRLVLMSTPFGRRGHFWDAWSGEGNAWERVMVRASNCIRIPAAFLNEERRALGDRWFSQEYECEFGDSTEQLFGYDAVMAALDDAVQPLFAPAVDDARTSGLVSSAVKPLRVVA